jgi:CRP-like cAMP-binding protein
MTTLATCSPRRIKRYLRNAEIFEMMAEGDLERLIRAGRVTHLGPGSVLFEAGDPSDRIHVVLEGALEILRATPDHPDRVPVAYVSPGEIIGDMALMTGTPRKSGSRVPEKLVVWTLTRKSFEEVAGGIDGYWRSLTKVYARRLEQFITRMRRQARRKELSGKLAYFDLPTVVQTLVTAKQTGILTLMDDEQETIAEVLLCDGTVERARTGPLEGEEAFYEIFLTGDEGRFFFRTVPDPDLDSVSRVPIHPTAINLLMEAVRRVDELAALRERLPDPDKAYVARTHEVEWPEERTAELAQRIVTLLQTPRKLSGVARRVPASTFSVYEVAVALHESEQID